MECYHPENNAWTDMPPMKYSRSGAGVAVLNQFIYVCGGFDGSRQLASVERFDTGEILFKSSFLFMIHAAESKDALRKYFTCSRCLLTNYFFFVTWERGL